MKKINILLHTRNISELFTLAALSYVVKTSVPFFGGRRVMIREEGNDPGMVVTEYSKSHTYHEYYITEVQSTFKSKFPSLTYVT